MDAQALGRYLRQSREARELTLEDAERVLHIRRRILESFELGDFVVPDASIVQIRGFIRNYARFLGLDEEKIVAHYDEARFIETNDHGRKQRRRQKKRDTQPVPAAPRKITDTDPALPAITTTALDARRQQRSAGVLTLLFRLLVSGAALAVIVFVVLELTRSTESDQSASPPPDILGQLPGSPTYTPPPTRTIASLLPTLPPTGDAAADFAGEGVVIVLETTQRTWLRVVADDVEQYAGIAPPGTLLEIQASDRVDLTASNARALDVVWNGQPQRSFGQRGQMVEVVFSPAGVEIVGQSFAPTSAFTATPLPTSPVDADARIATANPTPTSAVTAPVGPTASAAGAQAFASTGLAGLTTPTASGPTALPFTGNDSPLATEVPIATTPAAAFSAATPFRQSLQLPTVTPDAAAQSRQPAQQPEVIDPANPGGAGASSHGAPNPAQLGAVVPTQAQNDPLAIPQAAAGATLDPAIAAQPDQPPTITRAPLDIPAITPTPLATTTPPPSPTPPVTPTLLPSPTALPTETATPTPTNTLTPTATVSPTSTASPTPTAILPPRRPQVEPTPTKNGN